MDEDIRFVSIEHDEKLLRGGGETIDTCCFVKGECALIFRNLSSIFSSVVDRLFVTSNLLHLRNIFKKVGRK